MNRPFCFFGILSVYRQFARSPVLHKPIGPPANFRTVAKPIELSVGLLLICAFTTLFIVGCKAYTVGGASSVAKASLISFIDARRQKLEETYGNGRILAAIMEGPRWRVEQHFFDQDGFSLIRSTPMNDTRKIAMDLAANNAFQRIRAKNDEYSFSLDGVGEQPALTSAKLVSSLPTSGCSMMAPGVVPFCHCFLWAFARSNDVDFQAFETNGQSTVKVVFELNGSLEYIAPEGSVYEMTLDFESGRVLKTVIRFPDGGEAVETLVYAADENSWPEFMGSTYVYVENDISTLASRVEIMERDNSERVNRSECYLKYYGITEPSWVQTRGTLRNSRLIWIVGLLFAGLVMFKVVGWRSARKPYWHKKGGHEIRK